MTSRTLSDHWHAARDLLRNSLPHLRRLLWQRRRQLAGALALLVVSRLASLVLPASSKFLIDEVVLKGRLELLAWILAAVAAATLIQTVVGYSLTQLIGVTSLYTMTDARPADVTCRAAAHTILRPRSQR